ncbi:MAG: isochorismatase family protein [Deltaproteobacteria bacterium]|nr:isochorismatase family protein [Deltaproteobacteria bacterium]
MAISILNKENTALIIVDAQEKLMGVMGQKDRVADRMLKLLDLARVFQLPVIVTEQNPKHLGPTLPAIRETLPAYNSIEKVDFNCCEVQAFNDCIEKKKLQNIILTGVETHICVLQTCVSLLERGYRVHVPHHAVDSRTEANWQIGLSLMGEAGATITSTETIIFQILKKAGTPEFKALLKTIK